MITNRYNFDKTHAIGFKDLIELGAWIDENFTNVEELTGYQLMADGVHIRINSDLTSIILDFGDKQ
jgi:5'(3')-deoxyribonucleotidase